MQTGRRRTSAESFESWAAASGDMFDARRPVDAPGDGCDLLLDRGIEVVHESRRGVAASCIGYDFGELDRAFPTSRKSVAELGRKRPVLEREHVDRM